MAIGHIKNLLDPRTTSGVTPGKIPCHKFIVYKLVAFLLYHCSFISSS
ncbi:leucine-rich repeat extensin-like protein 3 [Iris pallida]|uniref:Leucine-rich repeat extensin-like protein 3 n=1 Tax=Iris pallida TaxID=29817 RepID=A0AAX6GXF4_IRIPA|nr:leucine-rich repeat extensin-like protein 3 [Iris pallida]